MISSDLFISWLEVTNSPWKGHRPPSQKGHQQNCQVNLFLNFRNKFVHIFVTRQHKSTRLPPSDAASFFFANLKICIRYIGGRVAYVGKQKEILFIWAPVSNGGWDFTVSKTVVGTFFLTMNNLYLQWVMDVLIILWGWKLNLKSFFAWPLHFGNHLHFHLQF